MGNSEHNFTVTADSLTKIHLLRTHTRYGFTIYMEEIWRLLKLRPVPISNPFSTVKLGSIMFCPSNEQGEEPAEVAFFPEADPYLRPWAPGVAGGEKTAEGWTRFNASDVCDRTLVYSVVSPTSTLGSIKRLIFSAACGFLLTHTVDFQIDAYGAKQKPSTGFLFLCPEEHFQSTTASFRWPEYPAYWRLFLDSPHSNLRSRTQGFSWDSNVLRWPPPVSGIGRIRSRYPSVCHHVAAGDSMLFEVRDTRYTDGAATITNHDII
ncbi:hypothetical protein C8J57DRAFT_1402423 [Mycena rebaudengoi]|nr:hypothetical protein C8J57DRAFT_1402423 [Mycena rebaudengoi]